MLSIGKDCLIFKFYDNEHFQDQSGSAAFTGFKTWRTNKI